MGRTALKNRNPDLQARLTPAISKLVSDMASAMKRGYRVDKMQQKLNRLMLIQKAGPYWADKPTSYQTVRTYLSIIEKLPK